MHCCWLHVGIVHMSSTEAGFVWSKNILCQFYVLLLQDITTLDLCVDSSVGDLLEMEWHFGIHKFILPIVFFTG